MNSDNILPPLFKLTSTGSIQQWGIAVSDNGDGTATLITLYGHKDGKLQQATDVIAEGKNVGKANETTPLAQANAEAKSQWEKKLKRGYVQSLEDAQEGKTDSIIAGGVSPMLAHTYEKQGHKIQYPAWIQPKLDGHRCIAIVSNGKATLWSRTQKRITSMPHIERALEKLIPGSCILDGELYNHDYRDNFEELTSKIRQQTPQPGHEVVQFFVYDIVNDESMTERLFLRDTMASAPGFEENGPIVLLQTDEVLEEGQMIDVFAAYIQMGFEGAMLRNKDSKYKHGRSYDLQKVKVFDDAEFEVIRIEEGRGKMAGKALFVCETEQGEEFRVKMVGALDDLADYLVEPDKWIGKQLTVKFQGFTGAAGVPRFPVALRFRTEL